MSASLMLRILYFFWSFVTPDLGSDAQSNTDAKIIMTVDQLVDMIVMIFSLFSSIK